jgi:ABC-type sugar transport system substrate-binding protein
MTLKMLKVVVYDAARAEVSALKNGAIQALIAQDPKQRQGRHGIRGEAHQRR